VVIWTGVFFDNFMSAFSNAWLAYGIVAYQKSQFWFILGRLGIEKVLYIFWSFGIFYGLWVNFMTFGKFLEPFGIFLPILVCCT
jgi:hypothetical protein